MTKRPRRYYDLTTDTWIEAEVAITPEAEPSTTQTEADRIHTEQLETARKRWATYQDYKRRTNTR